MKGSESKQSKAFVTGAMGFVGKHLAQRLVERGDEVCLADIQEHDELPGSASYQRVDVCDYASVRSALEGVDTVFHVASLVQTRQCDAEKVWAVNFDGTKNVIRACREAGGFGRPSKRRPASSWYRSGLESNRVSRAQRDLQ